MSREDQSAQILKSLTDDRRSLDTDDALDTVLEVWGGLDGFVRLCKAEYDKAKGPKGQLMRFRMLNLMGMMVQRALEAKKGAASPVDDMQRKELESVFGQLMKKVNGKPQQSQQIGTETSPPDCPPL